MAVFKCKMCGGDLEITEGAVVAECMYCGTKQTVPSIDNEKKLNLFNRANRLRMNSEFDKAASLYENIIAEFPEEAEAYWGLCLCNYGIEYVDDPATGRKIPTCHRASFEKLQNDENYELAMEYGDLSAQALYRAEAREIDRIMGEILSISKNEEPYDVFICYKETDSRTGERTIDSVLAYDIYEALTARGLKVFFARVTLEEKLGRQYEPYIFAALNSSKVMLSIGTKYEYFNAVWVKNEWSRFLKLMTKDKEKVLIPCYKDMDAYDLPDEFRMLQAQDLGKIGANQDIVRGIMKIVSPDETLTPVKEQKNEAVTVSPTSNNEAYLKRVELFLEDKNWAEADAYCERVLDTDPENARAYLGKLMAELHVSVPEDMKKLKATFERNSNYQKILRFADDELKTTVIGYYQYVKEVLSRPQRQREEACRQVIEELKIIKAEGDFPEKYRRPEVILLEMKNVDEFITLFPAEYSDFSAIEAFFESYPKNIQKFIVERSQLGMFDGARKKEIDAAVEKLQYEHRRLEKLRTVRSNCGGIFNDVKSAQARIDKLSTELAIARKMAGLQSDDIGKKMLSQSGLINM